MAKVLTVSFGSEDEWILERIAKLKKSKGGTRSALVRNLLAVGLKISAPVTATEMVEAKEMESKAAASGDSGGTVSIPATFSLIVD